jgi:hypothetical protein
MTRDAKVKPAGAVYADVATIVRLTNRTQFAAQRRQLDALRIPYRQAANGEPLVRVIDLDGTSPGARKHGPKWERIN